MSTMFAASIPLLPPPPTSLLPPLHDRPGTSTNQQYIHSQDPFNVNNATAVMTATNFQNRAPNRNRSQHTYHPHHRHTPLQQLTTDERTVAHRKTAIAMYGWSWLKPAGCSKTMLGRREEENEREEVERQLRELEMQERNALEVEEAERRGRLEDQATREAAGEVLEGEEGERDLDGDVPDADADDFDEEEREEEDYGEDEDGIDMDDDVPDAEDSNWVYDTNRDPDSESGSGEEDEQQQHQRLQRPAQIHNTMLRNVLGSGRVTGAARNRFTAANVTTEEQDQAEQEALVNEMLDEDELGGVMHERDLDDDVPEAADVDIDMDGEHDLDDDVPEAGSEDDGGWEHTDTEQEDSEMDISVLNPAPARITAVTGTTQPIGSSAARRQRRQQARANTRYSRASEQSIDSSYISVSSSTAAGSEGGSMRRTSGNMLPPALPALNAGRSISITQTQGPRRRHPVNTPNAAGSELSISGLISSSAAGSSDAGTHSGDANAVANGRRGWLNAASARRNLFGAVRNTGAAANNGSVTTAHFPPPPAATTASTTAAVADTQNQQTRSASATASQPPLQQGQASISSGGLFTPSPRQPATQEDVTGQQQTSRTSAMNSAARTRSGRLAGRVTTTTTTAAGRRHGM